MLKQGDVVVYKCKGMYEVQEVGTLDFGFVDRKRKYYTLQSMDNERDKVYVPVDDNANVRRPLTKDEAMELVEKVDSIETLWVANEKLREQEYKKCISTYSPENWVQVLKTLYSRAKKRGSITSMDKKYQQLLEHVFYGELSYVLGIPVNKVESFIMETSKK
ncbi:MAG: CarD family transcriptional regulator [Schaedlerella sp.]|nr:CarD family transcriptional regulator [Schaedlerella sp.]